MASGRPSMRRISIVVPAFAALAVTACGGSGDDDDTPDRGTNGSSGYVCSEVWVLGETLPEDYDGTCTDDEGNMAVSGTVDCEDGSAFSTYDDRFFAKLGGEIMAGPEGEDGERDETLGSAYDSFYRACTS